MHNYCFLFLKQINFLILCYDEREDRHWEREKLKYLRLCGHEMHFSSSPSWITKSNKPTGTSYELHKECEYILGKETQGIWYFVLRGRDEI